MGKQDACNPLVSFLFPFFGFCFLRFFCSACFIFRFIVYRYCCLLFMFIFSRDCVSFVSFSLVLFEGPNWSKEGIISCRNQCSRVEVYFSTTLVLQYLGFLSYPTPAGACRVLPTRFFYNCGESIDSLSVLLHGPNNSVRPVPTPALL